MICVANSCKAQPCKSRHSDQIKQIAFRLSALFFYFGETWTPSPKANIIGYLRSKFVGRAHKSRHSDQKKASIENDWCLFQWNKFLTKFVKYATAYEIAGAVKYATAYEEFILFHLMHSIKFHNLQSKLFHVLPSRQNISLNYILTKSSYESVNS